MSDDMDDGVEISQRTESKGGDWQNANLPFSVTALANIFSLDKQTIRKKLTDCEKFDIRNGAPRYLIKTAAPFLVKPVFDIAKTLASMRTQDMPLHIRKEYWQAKESQQRFQIRAGELWHSDDVESVFAEVFNRIRGSLQTWDNSLEQATGLTDEQRHLLRDMLFELQEDIYAKIKELPSHQRTLSALKSDEEYADDSETPDKVESEDLMDLV